MAAQAWNTANSIVACKKLQLGPLLPSKRKFTSDGANLFVLLHSDHALGLRVFLKGLAKAMEGAYGVIVNTYINFVSDHNYRWK